MVFWPLILLAVILVVSVPMLIYWQSDIFFNLEMLITGVNMPEDDWMLIFLVPAFILGLPAMLSYYGGELMESQVELYTYMTQSVSTTYGLIGWVLTMALLAVFFYCTIWCVQRTLGMTAQTSSNHLALLTLILGGVVLYI